MGVLYSATEAGVWNLGFPTVNYIIAEEPEPEGVSVTIANAIPEGWTYITNNPTYPNPGYYSSGALKINFVGMGIQSPVFTETYHTVTIGGALNANTKTEGDPTALDLVVSEVTVDTWVAEGAAFSEVQLTSEAGFTQFSLILSGIVGYNVALATITVS
jgi:hypothetical protein